MIIHFHSAARREFDEAAMYYEEQQTGLGDSFTAEVEAIVERIARTPNSFPKYPDDDRVRFCQTRRFPYLVLFVFTEDTLEIVSVMHGRRRPAYWSSRLNDIPDKDVS